MSTVKDGRKKAMEPAVISWKQKKDVADQEEEALLKDIEDLRSWVQIMENKNFSTVYFFKKSRFYPMNDEQLKEYLKNRPEELKTVKIQKSKPRQKVQRFRKAKSSASMGIMASVWKFHKDDSEDSVRPDV